MLGRSSLLPKQLPRSPGSLFPTHTSTLRLQSRRAPVQQRATSRIGLDISTPRIKPRTRYEVEGYSAFSTIRMAPTRCHHFFYRRFFDWRGATLTLRSIPVHETLGTKAVVFWLEAWGREKSFESVGALGRIYGDGVFTTSVLPAWGLPGCMSSKDA
jgi:hypothetical protein